MLHTLETEKDSAPATAVSRGQTPGLQKLRIRGSLSFPTVDDINPAVP